MQSGNLKIVFLLTLLGPMEFSINFDKAQSGWSIIYILRGHRLYFPQNIAFLFPKIVFVLTNSVDPDEVLHYASSGSSLFAKEPK